MNDSTLRPPAPPSSGKDAMPESRIDLSILLQEDKGAPTRVRNMFIIAVLLHVALFVIHFPKRSEAPPPKEKEIVPQVIVVKVIPPPKIPPPPKPEEKKIRMAVPDPTPDEPEPIREPDPEPMPIIPPGVKVVVGIPPGPPAPSGPLLEGSAGTTKPIKVSGADPEYPEVAKRSNIQGVVNLVVTINEKGDVVNVEVLQGAPLGMTESAVAAVWKWKYNPGTLHGRPVSIQKLETIRFEIQR